MRNCHTPEHVYVDTTRLVFPTHVVEFPDDVMVFPTHVLEFPDDCTLEHVPLNFPYHTVEFQV